MTGSEFGSRKRDGGCGNDEMETIETPLAHARNCVDLLDRTLPELTLRATNGV
jgi:hypothetical protein